jgi:hypothetical protein
MKKLIFHIGTPKTGTTAIQAFLSSNTDLLLKQGVHYPFPESQATIASGACSGNLSAPIFDKAKTKNYPYTNVSASIDACFQDVVEMSVSNSPVSTILFSGEFLLSQCSNTIIETLCQLSKVHQVEIKVFIRDPYDYFISAWKQQVKQGYIGYPHELLKREIQTNQLMPKKVGRFIQADLNIEVTRYESVRSRLVSAFLSNINIDIESTPVKRMDEIHNSSLSFSQALLIVMTGRILKRNRALAVATKKYLKRPPSPPDPYLLKIDKAIRHHCENEIRLINEKLSPNDHINVLPQGNETHTPVVFSTKDIATLFETLATVKERPEHDQYSADNLPLGLPPDFDPVEYLLRNPDVAQASFEPVSHYLNHGRYEGRVFKAHFTHPTL